MPWGEVSRATRASTRTPCTLLDGDPRQPLAEARAQRDLPRQLPSPAPPDPQPRACSLAEPPDAFRAPTVCQAHAGDRDAEVWLANR